MPVASLPFTPTSVTSCVAVLRWEIAMAGLAAVLVARQFSLPLLALKAAPMMCSVVDLISGSEPSKPEYLPCQGSVDVRIVAVPAAHGPSIALVM